MNLKSKPVLFTLIILLGGINISIQSLDVTSLQFNANGFYRLNPNDINHTPLWINKLVRLLLNLGVLGLVQTILSISNKSQFSYLYYLIAGLAIIDIFLIQGTNFIAAKCHEFIHPLAFTPLIPFVFWAIYSQKNRDQSN